MNRSLAIGFIVIHCICMMMLNNILRRNSMIALEALKYRESNVENLNFFVRIIFLCSKEIKN
jgi:hypothetical protein